MQGDAVWIQSQPEILAIGSEYGIYVVDGEIRMTGIEIPELEQRRLGVDLQNAVVLRAETARQSAAHTLVPMLVNLGFKAENIKISFRKKFTSSDLSSLIDGTSVENK